MFELVLERRVDWSRRGCVAAGVRLAMRQEVVRRSSMSMNDLW